MTRSRDVANIDTILTTKGDIYAASAAYTPTRLGVGSNGQVLSADSSTSTGLKWANSGLVLIGATTFTSSTAVNIDNVFSSTYRNYILDVNYSSSSNTIVNLRGRSSGSTDSGATSYRGCSVSAAYAATSVEFLTNVTDRIRVMYSVGSQIRSLRAAVMGPNIADWTSIHGTALGANSAYTQQASVSFAGNIETSTQYDGFSLYPDGGNLTGVLRVYGMVN